MAPFFEGIDLRENKKKEFFGLHALRDNRKMIGWENQLILNLDCLFFRKHIDA